MLNTYAMSAALLTLMLAFGTVSAMPTTEWSQTFAPEEIEHIVNAVQTEDGGYALFGTASDATGTSQLRIIKLNPNGFADWIYTSSEDMDVVAVGGLATQDGGY